MKRIILFLLISLSFASMPVFAVKNARKGGIYGVPNAKQGDLYLVIKPWTLWGMVSHEDLRTGDLVWFRKIGIIWDTVQVWALKGDRDEHGYLIEDYMMINEMWCSYANNHCMNPSESRFIRNVQL